MRITYKMTTGNYNTNLNNLSTDLDKLNNQVATGRKFSSTSEDVSSAVKAYQVRRDLTKVEGYQNNIDSSQDFMDNSESTISGMQTSLLEATDKTLQGMNGTQSVDERKIIATQLRTIQSELLDTLNTKSSDTYIFGGSNTRTAPFTVTDGKLVYNGEKVDGLTDGSTVLKNLQSDSLYVDIGLGVSFDKTSGEVDKNSVFSYSTPGIDLVGNGVSKTATTDASGNVLKDTDGNIIYADDKVTIAGKSQTISNNVYDLLGQIASEFESPSYSFDTMNTLYGKFQQATQNPSLSVTKIGAKTNYLTAMTSRYEDQNYNLEKKQTAVEGVDAASAYLEYSTQQVAYKAALQMGSKLIQQSVFDYMS
ncbi:flagellar hook-associated protein 3 [Acetobacterium paludosum]|uniref:Flagellar hook-associated protein 3 n=1 Tax=Acetobacterium paludosum TaxID=52693 RepID=A0A923I246_9FIRM|nr:flagellar hook-associated protein FlgL [Acetobacterium paludosum]MBC3888628.1 flagellar hook-associated protein 3 [Acetobacterium paludosum]